MRPMQKRPGRMKLSTGPFLHKANTIMRSYQVFIFCMVWAATVPVRCTTQSKAVF